MQENQNNNFYLPIISFFSSIMSFFTMFYIFVSIAVITAIIGLKKSDSKLMSITSLVIVGIAIFLKVFSNLNMILPEWLLKGVL